MFKLVAIYIIGNSFFLPTRKKIFLIAKLYQLLQYTLRAFGYEHKILMSIFQNENEMPKIYQRNI